MRDRLASGDLLLARLNLFEKAESFRQHGKIGFIGKRIKNSLIAFFFA